MNQSEIKKIQSLGNKIGLSQRPVVTNRNILFVAGFLKTQDFKMSVSDGFADDENFLSPCIVLTVNKKPKLRFKNQTLVFKRYLAKFKKKSIRELSSKQYFELLSIADKQGETREYLRWRNKLPEKVAWLQDVLKKYNKIRKNPEKKEKFSILEFEDGTIRLDFGDQIEDVLMKSAKKLSLANKKIKLIFLLNEFGKLGDFLKKNF